MISRKSAPIYCHCIIDLNDIGFTDIYTVIIMSEISRAYNVYSVFKKALGGTPNSAHGLPITMLNFLEDKNSKEW